MKIEINAGKGGVGKTTIATACGVNAVRRGMAVGLVDTDEGHRMAPTLNIHRPLDSNVLHRVNKRLSLAVIDEVSYRHIDEIKAGGGQVKDYLAQFPGDLGIVPWSDMFFDFYGVFTEVEFLGKFANLIKVLLHMEDAGYDLVIIDVEPTGGLKRVMSGVDRLVRSLRNLRGLNKAALMVISGATPDAAAYLKGDYIQEVEFYTERISRVAEMIRTATYRVVCTPEEGPISQAFQVKQFVEACGGTVSGWIVNNIRSDSELNRVKSLLSEVELPVLHIWHEKRIHDPSNDGQDILRLIGAQVADFFG